MHRLILYASVLAALAALPAAAAETPAPETWQAVVLPAAQYLDVTASSNGQRYRIFVSVPAGPAPANGYPVLYVLDGNAAFPVAAFLARGQAGRSKVTGHVAPLVVGIGYPGDEDFDVAARKRDYTVGGHPATAAPTEGGADVFLDFIEQQLKPMIAARHPVDSRRQALFGHSFGGLLVVHALLMRPDSFTTFLASSPSIWWDDKSVLKSFDALTARAPAALPRVQISVGALEDDPPKGNYPPEVRAMLAKRPMVSEARAFSSRLGKLPGWSGRVVYHELAGEDHGPAWMPAMTRGMEFFMKQP